MKKLRCFSIIIAIMMLVALPFSSFAGGPISEAEAQMENASSNTQLIDSIETRSTAYPMFNIRPKSSSGTTRYYLNVYAGTDANGTNVCLWQSDGSSEQKWIRMPGTVDGTYMLRTACSSTRVLDAYRPLQSGANADIYSPNDPPAQNLILEPVGDTYVIRLNSNQNLVLTAGNNANNSNVTWTTYQEGNTRQLWYLEQVTNPYAGLDFRYMFWDEDHLEDLSTNYGELGYNPNSGHYGIDIWAETGRPIYSATGGTVIASGGAQWIYRNGTTSTTTPHTSMGYYVVVKSDVLDPITGRYIYLRYLHMNEMPYVYTNDTVGQNVVLGVVGDTGAYVVERIPHLHFDANTMTSNQMWGDNMTASNTINPVNLFPYVSFPSSYYRYGSYVGRSTGIASEPNSITNVGHWEIIPETMVDLRYIEEVGVESFEQWADTLEAGELSVESLCETFALSQADISRINQTYSLQSSVELQ